MTKFVFSEKEDQVFLDPEEGNVELSNWARIGYRVDEARHLKLTINGFHFDRESLGELIDLLEAFRAREDIAG